MQMNVQKNYKKKTTMKDLEVNEFDSNIIYDIHSSVI